MKRDRLVLLILVFAVVSCGIGIINAAIPNNTLRNNWLVITGVNVTGSYQIDGNDIITGAGIADFVSVDADQYTLATVNKTDLFAYPQQEYSYLIWRDGATYYAKNGTSGLVTSNGNFTTLFQSAIDKCDDYVQSLIFLKAGYYDTTGEIQAKGRITIRGENIESTTIRASGAFAGKMINWSPTGSEFFLQIEDIKLHGMSIASHCLYVSRDNGGAPSDLLLSKVFMLSSNTIGFYDNAPWGAKIDRCLFEFHNGIGLYISGNAQWTVSNCFIAYNEGSYGFQIGSSLSGQVIGNTIYMNDLHGLLLTGTPNSIIISNNYFQDNGYVGVGDHIWLDSGAKNCTIIGNIFKDTGSYVRYGLNIDGDNQLVIANRFVNITNPIDISVGSTGNIINRNFGYTGTGDTRLNGVNMEMWNSTAWIVLGP